jgi:DNA-binding transcriptional LysR family regulator
MVSFVHDLRALRSLVAVIDHGSIVEASRALGYSTAAVSRHIAMLERELGVTLFKRTARSIRPSVAARVLADKANLLLEEAAQFDRDARALARGEEGVIRLAYFRAAGTTVIPPALTILAKHRPNVRVLLVETALSEEVVELLNRGEADLGFVWGFPEPAATGLKCSPLFAEALVLMTATSRDDLHENPADLALLARENFAMAPGHLGAPPYVDRMFLTQGLQTPTVTHRPNDHAMLRSLVSAGIVVCLIPALGVSDESPGVSRSVAHFDFRRTYLARSQDTLNPLVPALTEAIRLACADYRGFGLRFIG